MPELTAIARSIFRNAIEHCSIPEAFARTLRINDFAGSQQLVIGGSEIVEIGKLSHVRIVAVGKAASPMLDSLLSYLPSPRKYDLKTVLISSTPPLSIVDQIELFAGGHPLPNQDSFDGAAAALSMLKSVSDCSPEDALCIFLVSGGASAMMESPLDRTSSLADCIAFHQALIGSGANIVEMNCVRKHFSAVKGGRLAVAAGTARKVTFLVSDVPSSHLDALGSGPTLPDSSTTSECREIIARYGLNERFPPAVREFFGSPGLPETPKAGTLHSPAWKLLDSEELALAAQQYAINLGFHTIIDNTCDDWPYDRASEYLLNRMREIRREHPRACLISCGEITVTLPLDICGCHGGRNQHFALYSAIQLKSDDWPIAILSAGSDGIDGNSEAAGAVVCDRTLRTPVDQSSAYEALRKFDSFSWLNAAGTTIVTGPTGQNLRDLRILLADSGWPS